MATREYLGMIFIFNEKEDIEKKWLNAVEVGIRAGMHWIDEDLNVRVRWDENTYVVEEYTKEDIMELWSYSGAEWLAGVKPIKMYKREDIFFLLKKVNLRIAGLYSSPFPPERYLKKYRIRYDKNHPWLMPHKGSYFSVEADEIEGKPLLILDFWSVSKYIEDSDPPLSNAVEEFLVELMRDIVKATEPEYAYFDENEYAPLEKDPVCEDMEGLMGRTRYPDMDVIYVLESHLLAIKKSYLEKWIGKEGIEEIKSGKNICRDGKAKIEDLGKWYMMYCEGFIPHLYYFYYEDKKRTKEDRKVLELMRECRREKGVGIYGICGDNERGYTLKVSSLKKYRDEEIEEFIKDMARKKGLKINKVIIYH